MVRFFFLVGVCFFLTGSAIAQHTDSIGVPVDILSHNDSVSTDTIQKKYDFSDTLWKILAADYSSGNFSEQVFKNNKFFGFTSQPVVVTSEKKIFHGKEDLFYSLIGLLLVFAFIRISFSKYFGDLFRVAFQTTTKQRQISEQLIQTPLPSLLLNIFFLITASFYLTFVLEHFDLTREKSFWMLCLYGLFFLGTIYVVKFLSLKFFGWLFNISETTNGYIFIVFMINKIIGIFLLPFLILLSFSHNLIYQVSFTLSYFGVLGLFAYRFLLAYALVRNQVRLHPFHFFLYVISFEILPLLLIYKLILFWL